MALAANSLGGVAMTSGFKVRRHDMIGSIEAAYDVESDDAGWLQGILSSVAPALDQGGGVLGVFYDGTQPSSLRLYGAGAVGIPTAVLQGLVSSVGGLTLQEQQLMYLRSPRVMASASEIIGAARMLEYAPKTPAGAHGVVDTVGIKCHEPEGWGVMIGISVPHLTHVNRRTEATWSRLAAHVTAALRIRRRLKAASNVVPDPDAVLTVRGTLSHAEAAAKEPQARDLLGKAVRAREGARGSLRRTDPEEAVGLWQALVDGRWSLLDQIDTDGRRWVLARRNAPMGAALRSLTARERQVLAYVAIGQSNKLIAYTLGLTSAAIGNLIARASRKLGSSSRVDLIERIGKAEDDGGNAA
jgi:DNA-binding CsgD family transcriptional regulator